MKAIGIGLLFVMAAGQTSKVPELTKADAAAMTAGQLADLLLPEGHPPIQSAQVHPAGMEANSPYVTAVELFARAETVGDRCTQQVFTVKFEAAAPLPTAVEVAARPVRIATTQRARLADLEAAPEARCIAEGEQFIDLARPEAATQLGLARQLDEARRALKTGGQLPFSLRFKDALADESDQLARKYGRRAPWHVTRYRDGRAMLADFPVFGIVEVDFAPEDEDGDPLPAISTSGARPIRVSATRRGFELWNADLVVQDRRITRISLVRDLIPPF